MAQPVVEFLWWEGCPSSDEALAELREEMAALGLDPETVEVREISTDADAQREEFVGSPTIKIDGRDIQPPGGDPIGLTCRIYRLRDGRVAALPDREDVRASLVAAIEGDTMSQADAGAEVAPSLALPDTNGERHTLPPPGEAPATVVFWTCNHCPYALAWHDRLVAVANDYADRGVRFLAVNSNDPGRYAIDSPEAMRERVKREKWPFPYLWDETQEVARQWGAQTTPHLFVLDSGLRLRYEGAPDADHRDPSQNAAWLRAALDAVLAGEDPGQARTEPVGCSIKWRT
jgi:hypothetical protein